VPQLAGNSRFALFLPEKRPFFFESADLLRSPTDAFYTRSFAQPRWGLRGTWRDEVWAGSAFAIDDRGRGLVLLPGPYGTAVAEQPANRALAARAQTGAGAMQWGGLIAARQYAGNRGDNTVLGPDMAWQISQAWRLRGQWLHSRSTALDDGQGGLARGSALDGDRVYLRAVRQTGLAESIFSLDGVSRGFRHDSGFVNQSGTQKVAAFQSAGWVGLGPFNEFFVNVDAARTTERGSGKVVQEFVRPGLYLTGARNLEAWFEVFALSHLRTGPTAPRLAEHYINTGVIMTPALWFPLLDAKVEFGRLADTAADAVRPGARWNVTARLRPLARLELEPSLLLAWLERGGEKTYRESALQWLAVWHFDARHNLRAIVQQRRLDRLAEMNVAAENTRSRVASLTYTWRRSAGTLLYVGASQSREGEAARAREAFVKLQFDVDELRL
jgi:hypothetical protein